MSRIPMVLIYGANRVYRGSLGAVALFIAVLCLVNCGPSAMDTYMEGQRLLGQAERGSCKLVYDQSAQSHIINGSRIYTCLNEVRNAQTMLLEGQRKGHTGIDVTRVIEKVEEDIARLESMYRTISKMELEKQID